MREVKSRVRGEDPEFLPVTFTGTNPGSRENSSHISRVSFTDTPRSCRKGRKGGVTWEGCGWRWSRHSDGHAHTPTAAVLPAAAATAAGMAASAAATADSK